MPMVKATGVLIPQQNLKCNLKCPDRLASQPDYVRPSFD
jgi:hypothetical protein